MKISSVNFISPKYSASEKKNCQNPISLNSENRGFNYPKGFIPYFGARLHRTPEDFFSQEFNLEHMPLTVKNYLMTDYQNNKSKKPMQLQKEAFADLELCENIDDIKEMFPDEPLLKNLKNLSTLRSPSGYLYDLRYLCDKDNKKVLKSGEDLTVYLVKKVFLEGKDLKEINEDFKNDVKEELLDPEHYPDEYFQYSTLKAIGVNFPNRSYWKSLQATREDKEYVPYTVTVDPNRVRKPREYKPREISPEERQRRSERMVNRWLEMTPAQRAKQIEKMHAGMIDGANSTLFEYLSPIMIIAAEKAGLSDKMIEFFNKNNSNDECPNDLSDLSKSQQDKLQKFWNENPKMKKRFSNAIVETIHLFDLAKDLGEEKVQNLINIAAAIKQSNELKALQRKMSNPEFIKDNILSLVYEQNEFYPDSYVQKYADFLQKHKLFSSQVIPLYKSATINSNENAKETLNDVIQKIHNEFVKRNKRFILAANIAVANIVNEHIKDETLYTATPAAIIDSIHRNNLGNLVKTKKDVIEKITENLNREPSDEMIKKYSEVITTLMEIILKNGYSSLNGADVWQRRRDTLPKVLKAVSKNKFERNKLKEILKDYTPYFKIAMTDTTSEELRRYLMESVVDECVINFDLKK